MKSCFNSPMKITQMFGEDFIWNEVYPNDTTHLNWNNKWFYKDICNTNGHNGLDVVPIDKADLSVKNFFSGEVIYSGWKNGYGYRVGIWDKSNNFCEFHNHLEYINKNITVGLNIDAGMILGKMGATGIKGMARHNHISFCKVNDSCQRLNTDNSHDGWIDPLPFLS